MQGSYIVNQCHSGVTLLLVLLRCHSGAGVTPVLVSPIAGVLPVLPSPDVKKLFKSAINYVHNNRSVTAVLSTKQHVQLYVCGEFFTRQFSLKRRKHAQPNVESMIENPKTHQFTENGLIL